MNINELSNNFIKEIDNNVSLIIKVLNLDFESLINKFY